MWISEWMLKSLQMRKIPIIAKSWHLENPMKRSRGVFFRLQLFQFWPKKPAPTFDSSGYSWLNFETKKLLFLFDFIPQHLNLDDSKDECKCQNRISTKLHRWPDGILKNSQLTALSYRVLSIGDPNQPFWTSLSRYGHFGRHHVTKAIWFWHLRSPEDFFDQSGVFCGNLFKMHQIWHFFGALHANMY